VERGYSLFLTIASRAQKRAAEVGCADSVAGFVIDKGGLVGSVCSRLIVFPQSAIPPDSDA